MSPKSKSDLDTWCFWLDASLEPMGYAAHVVPTDPRSWYYRAPEVIRVDDMQRRSPLRGYARILWPEWAESGHRGCVLIRWEMDADRYGAMVDAAFNSTCPEAFTGFYAYQVSWTMREERAVRPVNPQGLTPESLAPLIVQTFDSPPMCPATIWARNKEKELHIAYDWSTQND